MDQRGYLFKSGEAQPFNKVEYPITSLAFQFGASLLETVRVYSSVIPFLEEHLDRAEKSAEKLEWKIKLEREEVMHALDRIIKEEGMEEGVIKIFFLIDDESLEINQFAIFFSREIPYTKDVYEKGIRAKILEWRKSSRSRLSGIKTMNYLEHLLARLEARRMGFDEAILLNEHGHICEGAFSNIFFIKGKVIYTPALKQGILPGITRSKIIEIASKKGFHIYDGKIRVSRIKDIHEVFITSSVAEVIPVVEIGPIRIGKGIPGEKALKLLSLYRQEIEKEVSANSLASGGTR